MKEGGKGGANTLTGLRFEEKADPKRKFAEIPGYSISDDDILFEGKKVATIYVKHKLYKNFLSITQHDARKILSKLLLPDAAILVPSRKTLFIIEMKTQKGTGSVDEKLQTCDFKLKQYQKLCGTSELKVRFIYLLDDWFKKPEYKDTLSYVLSVGCEYYFEELELSVLGLPHQ